MDVTPGLAVLGVLTPPCTEYVWAVSLSLIWGEQFVFSPSDSSWLAGPFINICASVLWAVRLGVCEISISGWEREVCRVWVGVTESLSRSLSLSQYFLSRRMSICPIYFKSRCYFWLGWFGVCEHFCVKSTSWTVLKCNVVLYLN